MQDGLTILIAKAKLLGLPQKYLDDAIEYLIHSEWGLCLDTIVDAVYEREIKIDSAFYEMVLNVAKKMALDETEYIFIRALL